MFEIGSDVLHDFDKASDREWLEANGVGGWASSSICGANTRRYHGLLVAGSRSRAERTVIVSKLDETIVAGGNSYELGCNRFPGVVHPTGHQFLQSFRKDLFPSFEYEAGGVRLRKTIVAPRGENTTIVLYEVLAADGPFELRLRPFLAGRDYHSLLRQWEGYVPPAVRIEVPNARFEVGGDWWTNFVYDKEVERGLDSIEDLYTPGEHVVTLNQGDVLPVVLTIEEWSAAASAAHAGEGAGAPLKRIAEERERREQLIGDAEGLTRELLLAADQFIVDRDHDLRTIIAGYHWFTDWGRDTMISLAGLCLVTRRYEDARDILRRFLGAASKGMIPNRFPDGTDVPAYNSVDAGLLMFVAVWQYFDYTWDVEFVRNEALPVLLDTIAWLDRGTRFNIHVDLDGLLYAGATGVQLTWMDAKVGDWVVTPRRGKCVEINALWYNALRIAAQFTNSAELAARASRVKEVFEQKFWNSQTGCCPDVIGDPSVRPNQLLALSLPFPLFDTARAESILEVCEEQLLTPYGLRTLSPEDPRYQRQLIGDQRERDGAYHQGTAWAWLLGPYITALVRIRGDRGREEARALIENIRRHLGEAGIGSISEVFDGDPPHTPRGCIAQAWSVAEVLRAYVEDVDGD